MAQHVRTLGWCFIIYSALVALVGMVIGAIVFTGGALSGDRQAMFITGAVGTALTVFLLIISLPGFLAGFGLLKFRPWARIVAIILGALNLFSFPFGTALGIYAFWVLLNAETQPLFAS
jgi:hypothetical protein